MSSELERIFGSEYLTDLEHRSMSEVRSMRARCQEIETGLSYLRRLVQGRLDIVGAELQRRRGGAAPGDLSGLISQLPEILADRTRAPGLGRLPQFMDPGEPDAELSARLDDILGDNDLESLPNLGDAALDKLHDDLEAFEREISQTRRHLFDRIDALQGEITRRYRTGEASVETLLQ